MENLTQSILSKIDNTNTLLEFEDFDKREGYYTIRLSGGLNGLGNWADYFKTLSEFIEEFNKVSQECWVISLNSDPLDDLFYIKIGIVLSED